MSPGSVIAEPYLVNQGTNAMRLHEYFSRTYILNLPCRTDRRREMVHQLDRVGIPLASGRVEFFQAIRPDTAEGFDTIGTRGCFLSHLSVLELAIRDRLENVLVLEDDLSFAPSYCRFESAAVDRLTSTNWGMVYWGTIRDEEPRIEFDLQAVPPSRSLLGAHFYGVHRDWLTPLVSFLHELLSRPAGSPEGGPMHLDGAYQTFRERTPRLVTLLASPSLGFQRSSRTDIHNLRWFDRTPLVSDAAELIRSVKNRCVDLVARPW